jgi:hypothetical protein
VGIAARLFLFTPLPLFRHPDIPVDPQDHSSQAQGEQGIGTHLLGFFAAFFLGSFIHISVAVARWQEYAPFVSRVVAQNVRSG